MGEITWVDWLVLALLTINIVVNSVLWIPIIDRWIYWSRLRRRWRNGDDHQG
jgi:hypothetical protein